MFADVSNLLVHGDVAATPCVPQSHRALVGLRGQGTISLQRTQHWVKFQLGDLTSIRAGTVAGI